MPPSSPEQNIRRALPILRLMQDWIPRRLANRLSKRTMLRVRLQPGVSSQAVSADGVSCLWLIPQGSPPDRALLYLHGGGFVYGLTPSHLQMVAYLAQKMGLRALMVDYRLAPAHPFPAALDDCVTAYRWLLGQGLSRRNIVVAGDSAGGNLTITLLMKLRDSGEPLPAAAACLSPVADLSKKDQGKDGRKDPLLSPRSVRFYNESYLGQSDGRDPLISPVYGDWHGLPPLLVHAGEDESLCADAVRVKALAGAAGVDVRLEIYPRMWHVWQLFLSLPQAVQSLQDVAEFLGRHLS